MGLGLEVGAGLSLRLGVDVFWVSLGVCGCGSVGLKGMYSEVEGL